MRMVSNETRDSLKKMGLSQKTMFVWVNDHWGTWLQQGETVTPNDNITIEPVYDLSFLVEALPASIDYQPKRNSSQTYGHELLLSMEKMVEVTSGGKAPTKYAYRFFYIAHDLEPYLCIEVEPEGCCPYGNPAEAAAQLLIYIVEQGYAEIKNGKVVAV